jgi:hypothetical protein
VLLSLIAYFVVLALICLWLRARPRKPDRITEAEQEDFTRRIQAVRKEMEEAKQ